MDIRNAHALQKINYGIYVVASKKGAKLNGQIVNTVFQVTSEPQCVAVCINKKNLTFEFIKESRVFSVSVLEKDTTMLFVGRWGFRSGRDIDKFSGVNYKLGITGAPIVLESSVGYFECEVLSETDAGTHCIFIGKVVYDELVDGAKEPLTYEYYKQVKKGKAPENAPTFVKKEEKNG
ncbi:MAG: flavin reductase family protein [Candidatus Firestonebacteria bacterium]